MMGRKRAAALFLAVCMLLGLCACGSQSGGEGKIPAPKPTQQPAETPAASAPVSTEEPAGTDTPGGEVPSGGLRTLSLQKQYWGLYDREGDRLLVRCERSAVTLWPEDAAKYPELAAALEQTANMIRRGMEDEYSDLCASLREDLPWTGEAAETWVSTVDAQVRRADSVVLSLLWDTRSDYGRIENFRGMHGTSYDVRTGRVLALNEVVDVCNDLANAVSRELDRHQWAGDLDYREAVQNYFANTPYDSVSWTLDYSGVTFWFADGELEEPGGGILTATVSFAEYPGLFAEEYMAVPEAYAVELPLDSSFFADLDGDGDLEELNVTAVYDGAAGIYSQFGIYAEADGRYHYEECLAGGFMPYYVKTAEGDHCLYLFREQGEGAGPIPGMLLAVFDVSGGSLVRVGEMNAAPGCISPGIYRVPTDPENFYLDDFDSAAQDMTPFAVGETGMPVRRE